MVSSTDRRADLHRQKAEPSTMAKLMFPCSIILVSVLLSPFIYVLLTRLGIGALFPLQAEFTNANALLEPSAVEVVAELPLPPRNIAVSSSGRIFFNFHPEFGPTDVKIAELKTKTTYRAFPNEEFQSRIVSCLSMRIDRQDRLWLLDFSHHGIAGNPILYAFALKKNDALVKEIPIGKHLAGFGSMLNDFQVDPSGEFIYIVDTSIVATTPSLIVYSLKDEFGYRILSSHPSMYGMSTILRVQTTKVQYGPLGLTINADSIALDRSGSKLYYGALTGDRLYSISTSHLLHYLRTANESLEDQQVLDAQMPHRVSLVLPEKPVTDGISTDAAGNIYLTALEHGAIAVAVPQKAKSQNGLPAFATEQQVFTLHKLVQNDELLRWPDGISFGPDGMYVTNSALHLKFAGRDHHQHAPFHIVKISTKNLKKALGQAPGASFAMPPAGH
jgi:sugar lactone lactonase YvrE